MTHEAWQLIEELRRSLPITVTQGKVVRPAITVLLDQPDTLEAIARAQRREQGSAGETE